MIASRFAFASITAAFVAASLSLVACSAAEGTRFGGTGASVGTGGSKGSGGSGGGPNLVGSSSSGSTASGGTMVSSAYAHTNTELFTLDPSQANLALSPVGTFDCIGGNGDSSMTDVAVNEAGDVWGISAHNVYKFDLPSTPGAGATVHCALIIPIVGSSATFYGLTFAPAGVLGSSEVLVAANTAGQLWAVDSMGHLTQHGTFGTVPANDGHGHNYMYPGKPWELSGDIVFLANNGKPVGFATVRDCESPPSSSNCNYTDTLVELDLSLLAQTGAQNVVPNGYLRGQIVKAAGCNDPANTSYGRMYGIAAYGSKVLGFSHQGYVVSINNVDGSACLVSTTSGDTWAGAAITTVAPVMPPMTM
jgi:hypothetical protein